MTRNIFIFIGTFVVGALIALVTRAALFNPHRGHEGHPAKAEYAPMVSNPLTPAVTPAPAPAPAQPVPSRLPRRRRRPATRMPAMERSRPRRRPAPLRCPFPGSRSTRCVRSVAWPSIRRCPRLSTKAKRSALVARCARRSSRLIRIATARLICGTSSAKNKRPCAPQLFSLPLPVWCSARV